MFWYKPYRYVLFILDFTAIYLKCLQEVTINLLAPKIIVLVVANIIIAIALV